MPEVPLTPEEKIHYHQQLCTHAEHNPPTQEVTREVKKWQCPCCKKITVMMPHRVGQTTECDFVKHNS